MSDSTGAERTPSEKQIGLAERLAEKKGLTLPADYRTNLKACRDFIDSAVAPSAKQVEFAKTIADETGKAIPADVLKDGMKLSRWIDENRTGGKGKPAGKK